MNSKTLPLALMAAGALFPAYTKAADLSQMPVLAGQVSPSAVSATAPAAGVQYSKTAVVRLLDKQTNRVESVTLETGKPAAWGSLHVNLQKCGWGVAGVAVQDAAWLDITAASGEPEFHGWMFNTFPSVATYDHPRYDVELQKCVRPAGYNPAMPARVAPPTPSGPDAHENSAPGDDEAPQGAGAAFVVPGIASEPIIDPSATVVPQLPAAGGQAQPLPLPDEEPQPADQGELQRMMDVPPGQ